MTISQYDIDTIRRLYDEKHDRSFMAVAKRVGVSPPTAAKYIKDRNLRPTKAKEPQHDATAYDRTTY